MSTPNTESVDAKLVGTFEDADAYGPGALIWEVKPNGDRHLLFMVPGEDYMRAIQVVEGPTGGPRMWGLGR